MARATLGTVLKKGDIIGEEFEVLSKLGEGGCGSVYRCTWTKKPNQQVAVKVLDKHGDVQRFIREAKVLRKTKHQNVVKLLPQRTPLYRFGIR
jgi:serine/threonine protein kinase